MSVPSSLVIILLGILSTSQTHLAKAMERQGIEVFDHIRARLKRTGEQFEDRGRKPIIYLMGLILNHTTFVYHLFVTPLGGTTALYTSMYGMGMITLLVYSTKVMKEGITRQEMIGAVAIFMGTLTIGVEGVFRPALDMAWMDITSTVAAISILLGLCLALVVLGVRSIHPNLIGLLFGLSAGICGAMDPFMKGVGQTAGGSGQITPQTTAGWIVLALSFVIGEGAVLITQWGFIRRARANILVPAYNSAYIAIPVILQSLLLPGYDVYWSTGIGMGLLMAGFMLMRGVKARLKSADVVKG